MSSRIKILFVSANPSGTAALGLDEEFRDINRIIRAAEFRDALELIPVVAARPEDIIDALLQHKPQVVHFSGHGSEDRGLYLIDDRGRPAPVGRDSLVDLVSLLKDEIRVVVLNACHSHELSRAVVGVIECAIGMEAAIRDEHAIKFSSAFYQALAYGRSVLVAFGLGKVAIGLADSSGGKRDLRPATGGVEAPADDHIPQLFYRPDVDPAQLVLIRRPFDARKLVRWVIPALLGLALVVGAIVWPWPGGSHGKLPIAPTVVDPVEEVAGRLISAYDHPLIGVAQPRTDSPDFPYFKLRQATFLTAAAWKGDANRLYDAIERLKIKQAFTGRDAGSIDYDRTRLLAGLDSLMQLRYGWLHDKVLPALKASGEATEVELPARSGSALGIRRGADQGIVRPDR